MLWIAAAVAAPPSADALAAALAEVPLDVAVAFGRCRDPGSLVLHLAPAAGEAWGCFVARDHCTVPNLAGGGEMDIPGLTVACAPEPAECWREPPTAGALPPFVGPRFPEVWRALYRALDDSGSLSLEPLGTAPELGFVFGGGARWIVRRTPPGLRWSRSLGAGPVPELGALPAVPLTALFGRPAWGLVGREYEEVRGLFGFSVTGFSLVTVVDEGDGLAVAAAASLGEDLWGAGGKSDVICPRVGTRAVSLAERCADPYAGFRWGLSPAPYEAICAPECTAGRPVRAVLVPHGDTLVPRDAAPVRALGELGPEALSVTERAPSRVRLQLAGPPVDLRGMAVRAGDRLGVVEAPCAIAPSHPVWLVGGEGDPLVAGTCWVGDVPLDGAVDLLRPDGVVLEHLEPR